jgi:hypothetical protein
MAAALADLEKKYEVRYAIEIYDYHVKECRFPPTT